MIRAGQAPTAAPLDVLMGRPDRAHVKVASDGRTIAYLAPDHGALNLWLAQRDRIAEARPVSHFTYDRLDDYQFCCGGRHLMYAIDGDGDEVWQINVVDPRTGTTRQLTPFGDQRATILEHNSRHPSQALVSLMSAGTGETELQRVNLDTGQTERVRTTRPFSRWMVDRDLQVRGGVAIEADGSATVLHQRGEGAEARPILELGPEDAACLDVVGFDANGRELFFAGAVGSDHVELHAYDTVDGRRRVVASEPGRDINAVWTDPSTFRPQVAVFSGQRPLYRSLDPAITPELTRLLRHEDASVSVQRADGDDHWIVTYNRPDGPVRYHALDRRAGSLELLFPHRDDLAGYKLAAVAPFEFAARDGLRLHGYVTFPAGGPKSSQPGVLLVHSGPWSRDDWEFNPIVQWIAGLGLTCLQVNFRGSTGAGKHFRNLGDRQWGRGMQDDLIDTVWEAARRGWVDAGRVAVFGASYGGYAALMAVATQPDVFRCAVAVAAPSSLVSLVDSVPPQWQAARSNLLRRIGDPVRDRDELLEFSPMSHAHRIAVPVLLAHGARDPRTSSVQTMRIANTIAQSGVECQHIIFDNEGHNFHRRENIERFYAAAGAFLQRHLNSNAASIA